MSNIVDASVINTAYSTEGSGGRKIVSLSNGWIVTVTKTTGYFYFHVSKDEGNTWSQLCSIGHANVTGKDIAITSVGTNVHVIFGYSTTTIYYKKFDAVTQSDINIFSTSDVSLVKSQNLVSEVSIIANAGGTELHACWSARNTDYTSNSNIAYAKGTIKVDGSVTWGTVETVTKNNASTHFYKPTIILNGDGLPVIIYPYTNTTKSYIICNYKTGNVWRTDSSTLTNNGYIVYESTGLHKQDSPTAIFVPKEVNGLEKGRIWLAWHGVDATYTTYNHIRMSYSDDGGVTWSEAQRLTTGNILNQSTATITANKDNEVFILFNGTDSTVSSSVLNIRKLKYSDGSWGEVQTITANTTANLQAQFPATIFDPTFQFNFTEPMFIYQNLQSTKVGFYGAWIKSKIDLSNKSFPTVKWYIDDLYDSTISYAKVFLNGMLVWTEMQPLFKDFTYVLDDGLLDNTNSLVLEVALSDGSTIRKELSVNWGDTELPLLECDIRYNFENTDGEIAEVITWLEHDAKCVPEDFTVTVTPK